MIDQAKRWKARAGGGSEVRARAHSRTPLGSSGLRVPPCPGSLPTTRAQVWCDSRPTAAQERALRVVSEWVACLGRGAHGSQPSLGGLISPSTAYQSRDLPEG